MVEPVAPGPLLVDIAGTALTEADRVLLAEPAVGGVILFSRNYTSPEQLAELTSAIRALRADLLIVADYEGGRVQRFRDGLTPIPPMQALGRWFEQEPVAARDAAVELAWLVAWELAGVGVDMPLSPVVDLDYGLSEVIGSRAFSADAAAVATLGGAFAQTLATAGSAATAKHFPGHGYVAADSHAELPVDDRSLDALKTDWAPFVDLIEQDIASVMMAHVRYPAIDEAPASLSSVWIEQILRDRLGFTGCVFCDDLSMGGAAAYGDYAKRVDAALAAGCDYLPVCNDRDSALIAVEAVNQSNHDRGTTRRSALLDRIQRTRASACTDDQRQRLEAAREIAARLMAAA